MPAADLAVSLTASTSSVLTGDSLTYTLTVSNNGPELATAVSLTNTLPAAATLLTPLPNCTGTSTLLCTWATLAPNSGYTLTYRVSLDGLLSGTITNSVAVTAVTPDTNPNNNEAALTTAVFAPHLSFAAPAWLVEESMETAVVSLTLDFAPATTVTVHYRTTGGTATPGADYEPISGTLTFAPGVTVQTIIIPLIEDNQVEDAETFSIRLESATNAILTEETAVVTIRDNDQQPTLYLPLIRKP